MYKKIANGLFWIMVLISIVIMIWGSFFGGFSTGNEAAVSVLLRWAYFLLAVSIILVIVLGIGINVLSNPKKSLKNAGIGIVIIAVVVGIAYASASSAPLVNYIGTQPSAEELKLTDTLLNLVYILGSLAVLSVLVTAIVGTFRK